jgi:hypothetical protein
MRSGIRGAGERCERWLGAPPLCLLGPRQRGHTRSHLAIRPLPLLVAGPCSSSPLLLNVVPPPLPLPPSLSDCMFLLSLPLDKRPCYPCTCPQQGPVTLITSLTPSHVRLCSRPRGDAVLLVLCSDWRRRYTRLDLSDETGHCPHSPLPAPLSPGACVCVCVRYMRAQSSTCFCWLPLVPARIHQTDQASRIQGSILLRCYLRRLRSRT